MLAAVERRARPRLRSGARYVARRPTAAGATVLLPQAPPAVAAPRSDARDSRPRRQRRRARRVAVGIPIAGAASRAGREDDRPPRLRDKGFLSYSLEFLSC